MTSIRNDYVWTPELKEADAKLKEQYGPGAHIIPMRESDVAYFEAKKAAENAPQTDTFESPKATEKAPQTDTFEAQKPAKPAKPELSTADKQEMIKNAKTKAAGWSILFGPTSILYYGLRSKRKVAKKFGLDREKDQDLIKRIKKEQVKATVPALLFTATGALFSLGGIISYICNKAKNPSKIDV